MARALTLAALGAAAACGESDRPTPNTAAESVVTPAPAGKPAGSGSAEDAETASPLVNSLSFVASGSVEYALESDASDVMLTGGCLDHNVIGMSFTRGQLTDTDLFMVRLRTAASVGPGETGKFAVSELGWYNGQVKPADLPTSARILLPDAYEGTGTLSLTRHEAGGLNGRLAGTVEGTVKQSGGENEATIKVAFDINLGCGNRALGA
ncbi:MAG: hypothetical protein AAF417_09155 [Pseudomonadota bacterium]